MRNIFLLFILTLTLRADEVLDALAKETYLASINSVIVFTSQDGLSSGIYRFTNTDTEMRMYNLPLQFHFDPLSENSNLFLILDIGYSDTYADRELPSSSGILYKDNRMQTYVGGIGIGIRYKATNFSSIQFGGEFLYSRVGVTSRVEDGINEDDIKNFFSSDFNDNYSYKLLAEYIYHRTINRHKVYAKVNYKLYQTLSEIRVGDIVEGIVGDIFSLRSQTSVASLMFSYETSPLYVYKEMSFTLEPFVKGNYIWGDLATVAEINAYGTVGLSAYWNTPEKSAYISRYFIEPSISKGYGIEGINLAIGFSLDF